MLRPYNLDHFPWSHLGNVGATEAQSSQKARDPSELSGVSGAAVLWQGLAELGNAFLHKDLNIKKLEWNQKKKNQTRKDEGAECSCPDIYLKRHLILPLSSPQVLWADTHEGDIIYYLYISVSFLLNIVNFVSVQFINDWEVKTRLSLSFCPTQLMQRRTHHTDKRPAEPGQFCSVHPLCRITCFHPYIVLWSQASQSPGSSGINHMYSIFTSAIFPLISALDQLPLAAVML